MRNTERGVSIWPFIISLVLLLVFVFLWYGEKGDREKLEGQLKETTTTRDLFSREVLEAGKKLDDITKAVGYPGKEWSTEGGNIKGAFTDPEVIAKALNDQTPGGPVKAYRDALLVKMKQEFWRPKAGQPQAKQFDLEKLPQGFKDKVKEVLDAWPGDPAVPPVDPDNAEEVAKFEADKKTYEDNVAKYRKLMDELVAMKDFPAYAETIGYFAPYELDSAKEVTWDFYWGVAAPPVNLEEWMKVPGLTAKNLRAAFEEQVNALLQQIEALQANVKKLELTIDNTDEANPGLNQRLAAEQAAHTADNARLSTEAANAKTETENQRVAATTAENKAAKLEQDFKLEIAKRDQSTSALENAIRERKERDDLRVARNEPDGILLDANEILGVAYVNLGNQDKVYPGLKFEVSAPGRGGIRVSKGEVVVTKVLDAHYSQARILSSVSGERPLGKGDWIANPLYEKSRVIRLYLAGELRKYPRAIAVERLARMGVVVEDKIHNLTDYVLVPDSMAVTPAPTEEGGAAPEAGKESDFDRLQRLARTYGANLITETMIERFLDY